jgi:hypothetical protein
MSADDDGLLPPYHSGVRALWTKGRGLPYEAFRNLAEARAGAFEEPVRHAARIQF